MHYDLNWFSASTSDIHAVVSWQFLCTFYFWFTGVWDDGQKCPKYWWQWWSYQNYVALVTIYICLLLFSCLSTCVHDFWFAGLLLLRASVILIARTIIIVVFVVFLHEPKSVLLVCCEQYFLSLVRIIARFLTLSLLEIFDVFRRFLTHTNF